LKRTKNEKTGLNDEVYMQCILKDEKVKTQTMTEIPLYERGTGRRSLSGGFWGGV